MEYWKPIKGYETRYLVSNLGRVKSLLHNIILVPIIQSNGYCYINLCVNNKNKNVRIHKLVAETFIPNPNHLPCVNHKDGNKQNNKVDNLEWCTNRYNTIHAWNNGLMENTRNASSCVVQQFDINGDLIAEYKSQTEASNITGIPRWYITKVSNNYNIKDSTKNKYGFIFKNKY